HASMIRSNLRVAAPSSPVFGLALRYSEGEGSSFGQQIGVQPVQVRHPVAPNRRVVGVRRQFASRSQMLAIGLEAIAQEAYQESPRQANCQKVAVILGIHGPPVWVGQGEELVLINRHLRSVYRLVAIPSVEQPADCAVLNEWLEPRLQPWCRGKASRSPS